MIQVFYNFTRLEFGQWAFLLSLITMVAIWYKNRHQVDAYAYALNQQDEQHRLEKEAKMIESSSGNPQNNLRPHRKRNSLQNEFNAKLLGLLFLFGGAVIRYVIQQDTHFLEKWQTHAIMFVVICCTWIYGSTRTIPRGLWDLVVNVLFLIWTYFLFT